MFIVGNQSVSLFINVVEIGDVFTKPLGISPIYQGIRLYLTYMIGLANFDRSQI